MNKKMAFLSVTVLGALTLLGACCVKKTNPATTADVLPLITVSDQSLGSDSQITVGEAAIGKNGWVVIYAKENGQTGSILGYTSLFAGEAKNIKISIDKTKLSPSLIAMLHYDQGVNGVFEFPGADGPVIKDQKVIMQEFNVTDYPKTVEAPAPTSASARKEFIITSKQWSFSPSEIKVKKGDTVVLKLKSTDVTHSIAIKDFGIDAKIEPGEVKTIEFVVDKTGTFEFICNIPCGVGHRGMKGTIVVE